LPEAFHSQLDSSRLRTRYVEVICWSGKIHCEQRGRNFGRHQTKGFRVTLPFSRNLLLPSPNAQRHTDASQFSIARKTLSHRWYIAVCSITHIVGESWRLNRNPGCIPGRKAQTPLSHIVAKPHPALIVVCLCLRGLFGTAQVQGQKAPPPAVAASSQSSGSVGARLATQDALLKEQFEDDRRASPESETAGGDYRDNAILDDYSIAASRTQGGKLEQPSPQQDKQRGRARERAPATMRW
jgi:hypothetical protein